MDQAELAVGVGGGVLHHLEAAEALLASRLHHLPGNALIGVVDRRRRPDDVAGEVPAALLEGELLVVEGEVHRRLPGGRGPGRPPGAVD